MNTAKLRFLRRFPKAKAVSNKFRSDPESFRTWHINDGMNGVTGFGKNESEAWRSAVRDVEQQEGKRLP